MKFIHVSDTHLGCEIPVVYREIRKKDFIDAFKRVVDFAIKENVDFIIHSGDFLDDYFRISSKYLLDIIEALYRLKERDIPIIIIKGNHDNKGQKQNTIEILKKLGLVMEANYKEPIVIKDVYIYGISEPPNLSGEELRLYYEKVLKSMNIDKSGYSILLFHGISNILPREVYEKYLSEPRIIGQDKFPNVDFYAFGHFHTNFMIKKEDKIFSLPGSTERTEISSIEERFEKGFYFFNDSEYKFVPTNARRVAIIEKYVNGEEDIKDIYEIVSKKQRDSLIKIKIRYRRDLYDLLRRTIDNLLSLGYLIIEEYYPEEIGEEEKILEEDKIVFEDIISQLLISDDDKKGVIDLFEKIKYLYEEYYSGKDIDIERIREALFKELV